MIASKPHFWCSIKICDEIWWAPHLHRERVVNNLKLHNLSYQVHTSQLETSSSQNGRHEVVTERRSCHLSVPPRQNRRGGQDQRCASATGEPSTYTSNINLGAQRDHSELRKARLANLRSTTLTTSNSPRPSDPVHPIESTQHAICST